MLADQAPAVLVIGPGRPDERTMALGSRIFIGRECAGVPEGQRVLLEDETVSRNHLEIRLDVEGDRAWVVDMSTNGTWVNGVRIERAIPVPLVAGDLLTVGALVLELRSERFQAAGEDDRGTVRRVTVSPMAMVVGDIVGSSTIAERTDSGEVMASLGELFGALRPLISRHGGTLNNYFGDALFAVWDVAHRADAPLAAVRFALDAARKADEVAEHLPARDPDGGPWRMGWGVVLGEAAVSSLGGGLVTVVGDAPTVAFRLAGLAGREGRAAVLVDEALADAVAGHVELVGPDALSLRGRSAAVNAFGAMP